MNLAATTLAGRVAKCFCGRIAPSNDDGSLFGFEYQGPGSEPATKNCGHCGRYEMAHPVKGQCAHFTPRGPLPYDTYYCGCRGWD